MKRIVLVLALVGAWVGGPVGPPAGPAVSVVSAAKVTQAKPRKARTVKPRRPAKPRRPRAAAKARAKRSRAVHRAFLKQTGYPHGRPGYVVDHVVPLACGGRDAPENLQWQTKAEAKAKDRVERRGCGR